MSIEKFFAPKHVPIQRVHFAGLVFDMLRLDQIHEGASGNKFFKLKYNFIEAQKEGYRKILTFGGAFSNHIAATAIAANECGFSSVGIIRGEEITNPTLQLAQENGMQIHFVNREQYRMKENPALIKELRMEFKNPYVIPEGGTNELAIKGTGEIHDFIPQNYNLIASCFGTGGTLAGLISDKSEHQRVVGISVLKGDWPKDEVSKLLKKNVENWHVLTAYHFGGYAKWKPELINFIMEFYKKTAIPLDPVYTAKMIYGLIMEMKKGTISDDDNILAIHSGGLQGIAGFNERFGFDLSDH